MESAQPYQEEEIDPAQATRRQRYKQTHHDARYGNYHQYYAKFRGRQVPDSRLALLLEPTNLLQDARVLDLGCNAGKLTYEAVACCGAKEAVGVDIDPWLVEQARIAYLRVQEEEKENKLAFECFDFVDAHKYEGTAAAGKFDVVLLLSVTKWVHLNNGDSGMRALFSLIYALLNEGGYLIVEPQPWTNYQSAVRKNKELKETFKAIQMRPPFEEELCMLGFRRIIQVEREEGGFSRPVHVWRKG